MTRAARALGITSRVAAAAAAAFVIASVLSVGGLADGRDWGDVGHYEDYAEQIRDGDIPYRDFFVEYPPAALPAFLAASPFSDYLLAFKVAMLLLGLAAIGAVAVALSRLGASLARLVTALVLFAAAPLALGHLVLNRYDLWPAALLAGGLAALLVDRRTLGGGLLGLAFAAKVFAAAVLPVVAIRLFRTGGAGAVRAAGFTFVAVAAAFFVPFVALAPGGVAYSLYSQASRALQAETLGGSLLLAVDSATAYEANLRAGLAIELHGSAADGLGIATTVLQILAIALVARTYWRGPETAERFVVAFAATVAAFVAFAKVLSPQYLVWLIPVIPLVAPTAGLVASGILLAALVATQVEVHGFDGLTVTGWAVWTLLVRNLLLVALFVLLLRELAGSATRINGVDRRDLDPARASPPAARAAAPTRCSGR